MACKRHGYPTPWVFEKGKDMGRTFYPVDGDKLKQHRVANMRSQQELADELGITRASLQAIETGRVQQVRGSTARKLLAVVPAFVGAAQQEGSK